MAKQFTKEQLRRMVQILKSVRGKIKKEHGAICIKIGDITRFRDEQLGDYLYRWIEAMLADAAFLESWLEDKHDIWVDRAFNRAAAAPLRVRWLTWMIEQLETEIEQMDVQALDEQLCVAA